MEAKKFLSFKGLMILTVLTVSVCTGCINSVKKIPIVVIRGKDLRTEKMELPLDPGGVKKLDEYLKKGGDWKNHDTVHYYKKEFSEGILGLLDDDGSSIEMTDLLVKNDRGLWVLNESAAKWFKGQPIYGIYNTCLNRPSQKSNRPFSLFDGHLWWVFYRDKDDLQRIRHVRVTLPVEGAVPPSWQIKD